MAYERLEPFGPERADYMLAILCSVVANQWRKKGSAAAKPADFLPDYIKSALAALNTEPAANLAAKMQHLAAVFGGKGAWQPVLNLPPSCPPTPADSRKE